MLLILFLRNILFRSKTSIPWYGPSAYSFKRINKLTQKGSLTEKNFEVNCAPTTLNIVTSWVNTILVQWDSNPWTLHPSVSKSIWTVWEKPHTLKFIFNCHVKTVALIWSVLRSLLFRSVQFQKLFPTRSRSQPLDIWIWTRDPGYQIPGKNGNEIKPLITISSQDFYC